jgi:hypothetical protein
MKAQASVELVVTVADLWEKNPLQEISLLQSSAALDLMQLAFFVLSCHARRSGS